MYKSRGFVKGKDIEMDLELTFEQAIKGGEKVLEFDCNVTCKTCSSTGIKPGEKESVCDRCDGSGFIDAKTLGQQVAIQMECPKCKGNGSYAPACLSCDGNGVIRQISKETINIPKGIYEGLVLRLSGKGNQTKHGRNGDLLLYAKVQPHENYIMDKQNIKSDWWISITKAIFGGKVHVQTVYGKQEVKI